MNYLEPATGMKKIWLRRYSASLFVCSGAVCHRDKVLRDLLLTVGRQ
jgi:hypothetical protein